MAGMGNGAHWGMAGDSCLIGLTTGMWIHATTVVNAAEGNGTTDTVMGTHPGILCHSNPDFLAGLDGEVGGMLALGEQWVIVSRKCRINSRGIRPTLFSIHYPNKQYQKPQSAAKNSSPLWSSHFLLYYWSQLSSGYMYFLAPTGDSHWCGQRYGNV